MIAGFLFLLARLGESDPAPFVYRPPRRLELWIAVDEHDPAFGWQLYTLRRDLWQPFPLRLGSIPDAGLANQLIDLERRRRELHRLFDFRLVTLDRLDANRISSVGLPKYRIGRYGRWRRFPVDPRLAGTGHALNFFEAFADEFFAKEAFDAWRDRGSDDEDYYLYLNPVPEVPPPVRREYPIPWRIDPPTRPDPPPLPVGK